MITTGYFITVEGIEGTGKSTAMTMIKRYLDQAKCDYVLTREPGGTPVAEAIRDVCLQHYETEEMLKDAETLLMFAARAQHIAQVIRPALMAGKWVVCDRFTDATYAYQGAGRGVAMERIKILEDWVQAGLKPDLCLVLDLPVAKALERIKKRSELDRIEAEDIAFFERARQYYLQQYQANTSDYRLIDASVDIASVEQQLIKILNDYIK